MRGKVWMTVGMLVAAGAAPVLAGTGTSCTMELEGTSVGVGRRCPYTPVGTAGTLTLTVTEGAATVTVECTVGGASLTATPQTSPQSVTFLRTGNCGSVLLGLAPVNSAVATAN